MDISRRGALLGLAVVAAPAIIRTPGLLMPVRYRAPSEMDLIERIRASRRMLGPITYIEFTPESKAMIERAHALGFWRLPPLQAVVRREAFRCELGNRKLHADR